jgi:cytochrome c oxidase subunit 1
MIAGTTGIHLATLATDAHYHDTYFVVAHFHYTIQGGAVIGLVAGLHFWFPLIFGRQYNEKIAKIGFVLLFIGFNATFLPLFAVGMAGMPRRYHDYPPEFANMHFWSSVFSYLNGLGYGLVFGNLAVAAFVGKKAEENPYKSLSLEWKAGCPPSEHNWQEIPVVDDWTYGYGTKEEGH